MLSLLNIEPSSVLWDNPYLQQQTARHKGCQVDYLIQTRDQCLYLCEIKFSQDPVGAKVIQEVQSKMDALKLPRGFSIRPILIHVNGVSPSVLSEEFFSKIIDFSELLTVPSSF